MGRNRLNGGGVRFLTISPFGRTRSEAEAYIRDDACIRRTSNGQVSGAIGVELTQPQGSAQSVSFSLRGPAPLSVLQLDTENVPFCLADVLHGVDHRVAPGEGAGLAGMHFSRRAVYLDLRVPVGEIDAHSVRVAMPRLDLAGWEMNIQHPDEGVLERQLVGIARDLEWIGGMGLLRPGCHASEGRRGE